MPRIRILWASCQDLAQCFIFKDFYKGYLGGRGCWESEDICSGPDPNNCQLGDLQQIITSFGPRFLINKVRVPTK